MAEKPPPNFMIELLLQGLYGVLHSPDVKYIDSLKNLLITSLILSIAET